MKPIQSADKITPPRLHWGGFATICFGLLIALAVFFVQSLVFGMAIAIKAATTQGADIQAITTQLTNNGFMVTISSFIITLISVPMILIIIIIKNRLSIKDYLHLKLVPLKTFLIWLGIICIFIICYDLITFVIGRPIVPEFMTTAYTTARALPLFWFALIVLAPVSEEIFFRGFLLKGFETTFLKPAGAVLLTSFLWATIHAQYDYYDKIYIFFLGLILGVARIKTKSVLTTAYLHSFMNLVATIETAIVVS